jgi:hypothetical protein
MTTVTGLTADRMLAIEAASVVDGDVDGNGNLILTKHDGSTINAGSVIGPTGPQGPVGSMLPVLSAAGILDIGLVNQIRVGRQLSPADFAAIGLNAPIALWNLSDLSDASGNGRALQNKGAVPFASGINGAANTAAQFVGNTGQALYIPDTGAADPFRIKTGSWGCWFRTAKRGLQQGLVTKRGVSAGFVFDFSVNQFNYLAPWVSIDGSSVIAVQTITDVCDDRWHFGIITYDGSVLRAYVDGILEGTVAVGGAMFSGSGVLNIGAYSGDSSTVAGNPNYGRVDEAFITADVLSDDQVRMLYCAKIPHTLGAVPARVSLNVRRRKKGAAFAVSDFPTQPLRLYNFSAGSLGDQGSNNTPLTFAAPNAVPVSGADGTSNNAYSFNGSNALVATDTGMPSGVTARSYGCWIKTSSLNDMVPVGWGTWSTGDSRFLVRANGVLSAFNAADEMIGKFIADAQWHFIICTEDNTAIDGCKRKLYIDGRLVAISTVLNAIVLVGANNFRIGSSQTGPYAFIGQIDAAFVCDYAMTADLIKALYAKGSQALSPSPKNAGDHVEGMDAANLYAIFDTLDSQHQVDLAVA